MKDLTPKDHAEAVATFRHAVIGPMCARELTHGELAEALREIANTRVRPPGSKLTKMYSVPTLERWLYAYRNGGLPALQPRARNDRGLSVGDMPVPRPSSHGRVAPAHL